jgi:polar amino acid transport system substrate-binding protein
MSNHLQALVPGGTLRAAINFGNPILAHRDPVTQQPGGVSVDLARELAGRLGVDLALMTFEAAGKVVEALKADLVDVAFVAIDPLRGQDVAYTAPYVLIEGAYLVRQDSPIRVNEEVDRPGVRVAVAPGSAYDLFLRRTLQQATLSNAPGSNAVVDHFMEHNLEVAAGIRQPLEAAARQQPGLRVLDGRFMAIEQAMGTPRTRGEAGVAYLRGFVEEMKSSGFVAQALQRHRIEGAAVAPAER